MRDGSSAVVYARSASASPRRNDAHLRPPLSAIVADPHVVERAAPPALVAEHPAFVIVNDDDRVRLLFEALALARGATASRIWSMLVHLPTSPSISAMLRGGSDATEGAAPSAATCDPLWCLDDLPGGASSLASLHYSLLTIEKLVAAPATSAFHNNFYRHNSGDFGSGGTPVRNATHGVRRLMLGGEHGVPGSQSASAAGTCENPCHRFISCKSFSLFDLFDSTPLTYLTHATVSFRANPSYYLTYLTPRPSHI